MSVEKIKLMELDLDIDLMVSKAAKSREAVEKLKAEVNEISKSLKSNSKNIDEVVGSMVDLETAGKKNSKEYKELESNLKALQSQQKSYSNELEITQSNLRKEQKEYSLLKRTVDVVNKTMDDSLGIVRKTDGSIDQLTQALARNRTIYRSLPTEMQKNSAVGKELKKVIDEQDAAYKELNSSIGVNQVNVGDYRGQLEDLFTSLKSGQPIVPALTTAFKGLYAQFVALAANPVGAIVLALTSIAAATKLWLNYNESIRENLNLVEQLTDETGSNADRIRQSIESIVKTYNKDFKETLLEVKELSQDFGLTYAQALEEYNKGLAKGGNLNQEFGDSIREYGPLMAQNGYQANEFISIINKGFDLGIYTDKLPDAIKEAGLSLNEQTKATRDALVNAFGTSFTDDILKKVRTGQISVKDALSEISEEANKANLNQQQWAELTASVFRGAGEDAGGAQLIFEAVHQSITDLEQPLEGVALKNEELRQSFEELEQAKDDAFKSEVALELQHNLKLLWNDILIKGINAISSFVRISVDGFTQINAGLGTFDAYLRNLDDVTRNFSFDNMRQSFKNFVNAVTNFDWGGTYENLAGDSSAKGQLNRQVRDILNGISNIATEGYEQAVKRENKVKPSGAAQDNNNTSPSKKKNTKSPIDKAKSENERIKKELDKEKELHLNNLQEIAEAKAKYALNELTNDIKNREARLNNEKAFTQEVYNANLQLFNDKHALRIKEIEEEKRLSLQKIENEKRTEEERINALKISQEKKDQFIKSVNEKAKAEQDLVNQNYNQKIIENDNQLNVSRKENQDKWDAQEKEKQKLQDEIDFQNKLLAIELRSEDEYTKRNAINEAQFQNDIGVLESQLVNKEITEETYRLRKDNLEKQHAETEKQIQRDLADMKMSVMSDLFGGVSQLLGENTKAGKAAAVAQATISTYQGITRVWEAPSTLPEPFATISKLASTATVLASGLGAVKNIKKVKYQDGGLLSGPSHAQGGIPFTINGQSGFEAEGGEYIVNKNSTKKFLPLLQAINGTYKGKHTQPNMFQNGGLIPTQNQITNTIDYDLLATKIADANRHLPSPKVAITEINTAQNNYAKVERNANF